MNLTKRDRNKNIVEQHNKLTLFEEYKIKLNPLENFDFKKLKSRRFKKKNNSNYRQNKSRSIYCQRNKKCKKFRMKIQILYTIAAKQVACIGKKGTLYKTDYFKTEISNSGYPTGKSKYKNRKKLSRKEANVVSTVIGLHPMLKTTLPVQANDIIIKMCINIKNMQLLIVFFFTLYAYCNFSIPVSSSTYYVTGTCT